MAQGNNLRLAAAPQGPSQARAALARLLLDRAEMRALVDSGEAQINTLYAQLAAAEEAIATAKAQAEALRQGHVMHLVDRSPKPEEHLRDGRVGIETAEDHLAIVEAAIRTAKDERVTARERLDRLERSLPGAIGAVLKEDPSAIAACQRLVRARKELAEAFAVAHLLSTHYGVADEFVPSLQFGRALWEQAPPSEWKSALEALKTDPETALPA